MQFFAVRKFEFVQACSCLTSCELDELLFRFLFSDFWHFSLFLENLWDYEEKK
jgi:hypothetical protein